MDGRLTKTKIKKELKRRIDYFESKYGFSDKTSVSDTKNNLGAIMFGRYLALRVIYHQINKGLFIDGAV